mgnify:FL=1
MKEDNRSVRMLLDQDVDRTELFGNMDANMKKVEKSTGTSVILRDDDLIIRGRDPEHAERIIKGMVDALHHNRKLDPQRLGYIMDMESMGQTVDNTTSSKDIICYTCQGKALRPKTSGQKHYVDMIRKNDMVFGVGPAGTGKTYLACAMAVTALKDKDVERIILARPAIEAGESLGFLPGDLQEKVDPYLRPLYDALFEIMGRETASRYKEKGTIEVVPLAYMRGRTLDNSFIILDEAQNTTREQMKMFLTRMGFNSKVVITGDVTQIDLPKGKGSGLLEAEKVLKGIDGIAFCRLAEVDVVRHPLVKEIIRAYSQYGEKHR